MKRRGTLVVAASGLVAAAAAREVNWFCAFEIQIIHHVEVTSKNRECSRALVSLV